YLELGPDFVELLNGDFAIALLDRRNSRLLLYKDRLGVKPLYYYWNASGVFAFASEIKAFVAAGIDLSIDERAVQQYFAFKYVPRDDTLFSNVKRLHPGSVLELDIEAKSFSQRRYWTPDCSSSTARLSYSDGKARLLELLEDAVRIRLVSDVPVGSFLSGGVDSSAIAYFLRDEPRLTHFCARKSEVDIRKEGTTADFPAALRLSKDWRLRLRPADIGQKNLTLHHIAQTVYHSDDLIADGSQIPSFEIARAASASCPVMLSGMGADEIFYGYASHVLTLLAIYFDKLPTAVAKHVASLFGRLDQGRGTFKAYRRWLHRFGRYYADADRRFGAFAIVGDLENSMRLLKKHESPVRDVITEYFPIERDPFESLTRFELDNFLVKNLNYFDRTCMAHGVEGRVPFMDHRLVEFALSLPRNYKMSHLGRQKRILKDALHAKVPNHILSRRKAGFGMPLRSIFSNMEMIDELLEVDFFGGFEMFDIDHIRLIVSAHVDGREDNSAIIYALISYQEWYKQFCRQEVTA
ncbi:MAG TPA: asparagine synthase (glutamine-hydrolyzing), partial [Rhodothermales bacterium]|nr:asparagine synthase (glutamine-hydrolyzing) [Rhodothermales bacterium]